MDKLISLQAAIALAYWHGENCTVDNPYPDGVEAVDVDDLEKLPSVQPKRNKGTWLDFSEQGYVECPFCHSLTNCEGGIDELRFCFSCGADMRGEQDG